MTLYLSSAPNLHSERTNRHSQKERLNNHTSRDPNRFVRLSTQDYAREEAVNMVITELFSRSKHAAGSTPPVKQHKNATFLLRYPLFLPQVLIQTFRPRWAEHSENSNILKTTASETLQDFLNLYFLMGSNQINKACSFLFLQFQSLRKQALFLESKHGYLN